MAAKPDTDYVDIPYSVVESVCSAIEVLAQGTDCKLIGLNVEVEGAIRFTVTGPEQEAKRILDQLKYIVGEPSAISEPEPSAVDAFPSLPPPAALSKESKLDPSIVSFDSLDGDLVAPAVTVGGVSDSTPMLFSHKLTYDDGTVIIVRVKLPTDLSDAIRRDQHAYEAKWNCVVQLLPSETYPGFTNVSVCGSRDQAMQAALELLCKTRSMFLSESGSELAGASEPDSGVPPLSSRQDEEERFQQAVALSSHIAERIAESESRQSPVFPGPTGGAELNTVMHAYELADWSLFKPFFRPKVMRQLCDETRAKAYLLTPEDEFDIAKLVIQGPEDDVMEVKMRVEARLMEAQTQKTPAFSDKLSMSTHDAAASSSVASPSDFDLRKLGKYALSFPAQVQFGERLWLSPQNPVLTKTKQKRKKRKTALVSPLFWFPSNCFISSWVLTANPRTKVVAPLDSQSSTLSKPSTMSPSLGPPFLTVSRSC
jgi:hypothetical protein